MPQTITNPLRILAVGAPDSNILSLLKSLTGDAPDPVDGSTAGLSHTWALKTQYYEVQLPIWIDEVASISAWQEDFMRPEAKEVICAVGAVIYAFRRPVTKQNMETMTETMSAVKMIIDEHWGHMWEGTMLAVAMPNSIVPALAMDAEEWEDLCREYGFEYLDSEAKGRNEFGELQGIERLREALEANEWEALPDSSEEEPDGEESFGETFAAEEAEINLEWLGVKTAVNGHEEAAENDEGVEELSRMMQKVQAIRGQYNLCNPSLISSINSR
jgi:hypothetical protein